MKDSKNTFFINYVFIFFLIISCAKRGSITGGAKDETPPKFMRSYPPNFSTNFKNKEIRIYFDELISLENPQEQIVISPLMKTKPNITPRGGASKFIKVQLKDSLLLNTTYTINFGASVVDNNEKNPLSFFQYVFSTGSVLDSLSFKGSVKDAYNKNLDEYVSVFLYELNEEFNDSTIYKQQPRYISSTLDSDSFEFKNLKAGKYHLIALKEKNKNYVYEPSQDKIGFYSKPITIPQDSIAELSLFEEISNFKFERAKQASKNKFTIEYKGVIENPEIEVISNFEEKIETRFFASPETNTLNVWTKPFLQKDSIVFLAKSAKTIDTVVARYKKQDKDSLIISNKSRKLLRIKDSVILTVNTPIDKINLKKIILIDKDTLPVSFKHKLDVFKNQLQFAFNKQEDFKYNLKLLPGAITDFLGNKNDTLLFTMSTGKASEYGNMILDFQGITTWPLIVQLLKNEKEIKDQVILGEGKTRVSFESITPDEYTVRLIFDTNSNSKWDTGNYLKKIQPEKVLFYQKPIVVRANWDINQTIILK